MGCTSSTEVVTDPITGQTKTKKKLGGAYPGQRRPNQGQYIPNDSQFGKDGTATVHFKAYGGGNALTLVKQDGTNQPETGGHTPEYIQVTLPDGVTEGQTIHVQAPDGKVNAIVVPPGFGPGSTFTVEFAREETAPAAAATAAASSEVTAIPAKDGTSYSDLPIGATTEAQPPREDDGFASGFGKPPTASATTNFSHSNYPSTSNATPIYGKTY